MAHNGIVGTVSIVATPASSGASRLCAGPAAPASGPSGVSPLGLWAMGQGSPVGASFSIKIYLASSVLLESPPAHGGGSAGSPPQIV